MSVRATAWAWSVQCSSPLTKLVLLKLCDYANGDNECWPSQARIAAECGIARETVNRQLKSLQSMGFLIIKHQTTEKGKEVNRYFLRCDAGSHPDVTYDHTPCDVRSHPHVTYDHIEPSIKNQEENLKSISSKRGLDQSDRFLEFYAVYPRHEARGAAEKAWRSACKRAEAQAIIDAAATYAERRAGEDRRFTKLPATWLNADCWTDEEGKTNGREYEFASPKSPPPRPEELWPDLGSMESYSLPRH